MDFSLLHWKKAGLSLLLSSWVLLGGCQASADSNQAKLERLVVKTQAHGLSVSGRQRVQLNKTLTEAIDRGVPITLRLNMKFVGGKSPLGQERRWTLSYLPLSRHYSLFDHHRQSASNYPRLRHALAAFAKLEISLDLPEPVSQGTLKARLRIDRSALPAAVRLPAFISSVWQLDSGWTEWPVSRVP